MQLIHNRTNSKKRKRQQKTPLLKGVLFGFAGKSRIRESSIGSIMAFLEIIFNNIFKYFSAGGPDGTCTRNPKMTILESFYKRAHAFSLTMQSYIDRDFLTAVYKTTKTQHLNAKT